MVQFPPAALLRIPALGWTPSIPASAPLGFLPVALIRIQRQARVRLPVLVQSRMYRRGITAQPTYHSSGRRRRRR